MDEKFMDEMARRVRPRPDLMRRRQQLSEPPVVTIKRAMNQSYFLMKRFGQGGAEMSLTTDSSRSEKRGGHELIAPARAEAEIAAT